MFHCLGDLQLWWSLVVGKWSIKAMCKLCKYLKFHDVLFHTQMVSGMIGIAIIDCVCLSIPLLSLLSPCGCGDLSVRLGSRISPHRHRVVVEVHWHGAQGWRSISWVVATFNHVGGPFNLSMAATGDVWIIPSFRIWGYVLHVEHISYVVTNCGQLHWAIPSLFSIAL